MKRQLLLIVVATFLVAVGVGSVRAQNAGAMAVSVPFDFAAGGKMLPAGAYLVRRNIAGARVTVQLRSIDGRRSLDLPIHTVGGTDVQAESRLVFNKYGDQYFLSQVWLSGRSIGEELAKTTRERTLGSEMAKSATKPETIAISGKLN
jgi:hypothetical protein